MIGSRFLEDPTYSMGAMRGAGRQFFRAAARAFGLGISDPTSGLVAICLNYAVRLSGLTLQLKNLSQEIALLRERVERGDAPVATPPGSR